MRKHKWIIIYSVLLSLTATSCTQLRVATQRKNRLKAIAVEDLKGMGKTEVVKKFGQPVATSKSEVAECWQYTQPRAIWIWFVGDRVERWEVE